MCLITFAYQTDANYPLIVVGNRDEFYKRPTRPAHWWEDAPNILAGKDLKSGGTWLGINKQGYFAALTNYRDGFQQMENAPSRGDLVKNFLNHQAAASLPFLHEVAAKGSLYNGFNLLVFDGKTLGYYSNKGGEPQVLSPGVYGLSNNLLNVKWPKVQKVTKGLENLLKTEDFSVEAAFQMMTNRMIAPDEALPNTNIPLEWERKLSAMFIETPDYGTRCSTVVLLDKENHLSFYEKTYAPQKGLVAFEIDL